MPNTPPASVAAHGGLTGTAPVAYIRSSKRSRTSPPPSRSRATTSRRSRSMLVTSWRIRTSIAYSVRNVCGSRAINASGPGTRPLIQYGMPHAE